MAVRCPVITGAGLVTALGSGVDQVWRAVSKGACGLKPLGLFPSPRYGQLLVGEIQDDLTALGAPLAGLAERSARLACRPPGDRRSQNRYSSLR